MIKKQKLFRKFSSSVHSLNAYNAVSPAMLKCFNLNPKYLLQIPKTFLGIELLRIEISFFIGSSARVELGFHNTAWFLPLKVRKKFEFERLERKSFRSNLSFGHVRAVWRTHKKMFSWTFEFVSVIVRTNV